MSKTGCGEFKFRDAVDQESVRHGLKGGGRDGIPEDILRPRDHRGRCLRYIARNQVKVSALTGTKHQAMRPERQRPMIAIACPVMDPNVINRSPSGGRVEQQTKGLGHSRNRERYAGVHGTWIFGVAAGR